MEGSKKSNEFLFTSYSFLEMSDLLNRNTEPSIQIWITTSGPFLKM